jgi:hypothetical protein
VIGFIAIWALFVWPAEAKTARFTVGQTYLVVWACFPVQPQPCYVESLTVKAVHDDGWLDVRDEVEAKGTGKDNTYTVNTAQMIGFSAKQPERLASR